MKATGSNKTLLDQNTYLHTTVPFYFEFYIVGKMGYMKVNMVFFMDFGEANCEYDKWIELAADHIQWWGFV